MSSRELADFLSQQRAGKRDSIGQFTIDGGRALEKLGRSQLRSPELWAVKIVQAGVSLGCSAISVKLDYSRMTIALVGGQPVDGREIAKLLVEGQLPHERWKRHLVVGLRAFYGQRPLRLSWSDGKSRRIVLEGDKLREFELESFLEIETNLHIVAELPRIPGSLFRLNHAIRQTAAEHAALTHRCALCPIPLYLDGRNIAGVLPPPLPSGTSWGDRLTRNDTKRDIILVLPSDSGWPLWVRSKVTRISPFSSIPPPQPHPVRVFAVVHFHFGGLNRCLFIQDGVLLDELPVKFQSMNPAVPCGVDLYLDGSRAETDLTEFAIRNSPFKLSAFKSKLRKRIMDVEFPRVTSFKPLLAPPSDFVDFDRQSILKAIEKLEIPLLEK